ncbi:SEL1-like repeat protein [Candidatus Obscuribacterales bacterium]|nr:SEL1-like repeat protein [Candidatus Obscuribacterales bacterium]
MPPRNQPKKAIKAILFAVLFLAVSHPGARCQIGSPTAEMTNFNFDGLSAQLDLMEKFVFGSVYGDDLQSVRINRLEEMVFGKPQSGKLAERMAKLQGSYKTAGRSDLETEINLLKEGLKADPDAHSEKAESVDSTSSSASNPATEKDVSALTAKAQEGDAQSLLELGVEYERGERVPRSFGKAVECYEKAAKRSLPKAQHYLADMYAWGRGTEKNLKLASQWYEKAAKEGREDSIVSYASTQQAISSDRPRGCLACLDRALKMLEPLVAKENLKALATAGSIYGSKAKLSSSAKQRSAFWGQKLSFLTRAADKGDVNAQYWIASMYFEGKEVAKNLTLAEKFYREFLEHKDIKESSRESAEEALLRCRSLSEITDKTELLRRLRNADEKERKPIIERLLALFPTDPEIYSAASDAVVYNGDYNGAINYLDKAIALTNDDPKFVERKGDLLYDQGTRDSTDRYIADGCLKQAAEYYTKVMEGLDHAQSDETDGKRIGLLSTRADIYERLNLSSRTLQDFSELVELYRQAYKKDSSSSSNLNNMLEKRAKLLMSQNDLTGAKKDLDEVIDRVRQEHKQSLRGDILNSAFSARSGTVDDLVRPLRKRIELSSKMGETELVDADKKELKTLGASEK